MLVDSHCHLDFFSKEDLVGIIERSIENGVSKIVSIGTTLNDFEENQNICSRYPENVDMTIGIHPDNSEETDLDLLDVYFDNLTKKNVIGIGEIGLDYKENPSEELKKKQKELFEFQINLAVKNDLPISIHTRNSFDDVFEILKKFKGRQRGVFHCFCENVEMAKKVLDMGYFLSFSGIVTFKNASTVHEAAKYAPLDMFLVETDSPYLAPTPNRGKQNEPSFVKLVAQYLAELKRIDKTVLFEKTTDNFFRMFQKSKRHL